MKNLKKIVPVHAIKDVSDENTQRLSMKVVEPYWRVVLTSKVFIAK